MSSISRNAAAPRAPVPRLARRCDSGSPTRASEDYFLLTRLIPGQTETKYISSSLYQQSSGNWVSHGAETTFTTSAGWRGPRLGHSGCSAGHRLLRLGKPERRSDCFPKPRQEPAVFLMSASNTKTPTTMSASSRRMRSCRRGVGSVAMTIEASAKSSAPIQLSEQRSEANAAESQRIRKALLELPAVQVVTAAEPAKRTRRSCRTLSWWDG